ncbi:MAG: alpha/beta hydrolase [Bacteroidales bacterium]
MKSTLLGLFIFLISYSMLSQDITGTWNGLLKVQGTQLRLVFHITKTDTGMVSTMDSPDQNAFGIPVPTTKFEDKNLTIEVPKIRMEYTGTLKSDTLIEGTFKQSGLVVPMNLSRKPVEKQIIIRKQEPVKPYPYYTEEVTFENKLAGITLAGTLSLPAKEGNYPTVVMITGSGPQNRDEEIMGHKPFLVISDYLTRNGIGVLRFDDRGVGKSTGKFGTATTTDLATDVQAAVEYLKTRKEVNSKKIGLIGHSEGGIIAPIVAANIKDVAYIILLAGTGIRGDQLLLLQQELIARAEGTSEDEIKKNRAINALVFDMVIKSTDEQKLTSDLKDTLLSVMKNLPEADKKGMKDEELVDQSIGSLTNPWMLYFLKYDPSIVLSKVKCPVLALNGDKDLQVPSKVNLEAIKKSLEKGGNKKVVTKELPGLNHLFQECTTGSPSEYEKIEQTFSPAALKIISDWIVATTKSIK